MPAGLAVPMAAEVNLVSVLIVLAIIALVIWIVLVLFRRRGPRV